MRLSSSGLGNLQQEELWHACAGPLVSLPPVGCLVVYFPQGHIEQVAASTHRVIDSLPSYPSLPQLVCQLHNVTMHADEETDEVYAQMTLQTLSPQEQNDVHLPTELGTRSKQYPTNYFRKTLTASDTSTHGCCSIPRRAAEKVFPPLDFSQEPPAQELMAKDLHGNEWKFRHTFRGQPKRHLLTIGWTLFVNAKRLVAGDSVIFIWCGFNELLLGIRRAKTSQRVMNRDCMHVCFVAAHAAASNSPFTISYFPRASPSEFVIPLVKYVRAVFHTRLYVGMRFRVPFETAESSVRRYMGQIIGIGDLDPVHWPNSHWRSVKVSWDERTSGERLLRVSAWEIEPLTTFPMYSSPFLFDIERPWLTGVSSHYVYLGEKDDGVDLTSPLMHFQNGGDLGFQSLNVHSTSATPWMQPRFDSLQAEMSQTMAAAGLQEKRTTDTANLHVSPAMLQFQQTENTASRPSLTPQNQILQRGGQHQPPQAVLQIVQVNQVQGQSQSELLRHHLRQGYSFGEQQQQQQQQQILQQQAPLQQATAAAAPPLLAHGHFSPIPPPPIHDKVCHFLPIIAPPSPDHSCPIFQIPNDTFSTTLPTYSLSSAFDLGLHHFHSHTSEDDLSPRPSFHSALESLPPPD